MDATTTPPTVGINGNLIVDGSIVGEKIYAGAKIQLGDGGELIIGEDGLIQIGSGAIFLDSDEGVIRVQDPEDLEEGDFAELSTGNVVTYKYLKPESESTEKVPYPMRVLRGVESGVAANGTLVTLSNRYPKVPNIMVSPKAIMTHKANVAGDQVVNFSAADISYSTETGIVTFFPTATLTASGVSGTLTPATEVLSDSWSLSPGTPVTQDIRLTFGSLSIPGGPGSYTITGKIFCMLPYFQYSGSSGVAQEGFCILWAEDSATSDGTLLGQVDYYPSYVNTSSEPTAYYSQFSATINIPDTAPRTVTLIADFYTTGVTTSTLTGASISNGAKAWARFVSCSYDIPGSVLSPDGTLNYIALSD